MMKCFDSIYRNALWLKMYKLGIKGKLLRIIRDMYQKVKSCVKSLKALNVLFYNCKKFYLKPKILCQLFDAFIGSIYDTDLKFGVTRHLKNWKESN
jgi:hypothetical protein